MKKIIFGLVWLIGFAAHAQQRDFTLYQRYRFIQNGDTLPYRLLLPENYDARKAYPLVLFLHGRGESGNDNEKQLTHGASLFLRDSIRKKYPAIVVFPQCAETSYWSNVQTIADSGGKREFYFVPDGPPSQAMQLLISLTGNLQGQYKIKQDQVYVMGLSMGGMGTFELVRRMPNTFAAAAPICGGANPATASSIKNVKWWIFHGAKDDVVPPVNSEKMVAALKKAGASVRFTLYPNANHNSWDPAFAEPELLTWLFSIQKSKK
ncbi:prolyl oligopeptidase family serine peptidase [Nostoc ellipsosporum NOK]|nr:prolyl oligopeptidase family serine peptidase [Nostoc ellipsosporum NOK]